MTYKQERITPYHNGQEKSKQVEAMFDNIAHSYDLLNHRLSFGIDYLWRNTAIRQLMPYKPASILDIATGTGDFAIMSAKKLHPEKVVGIDISEGMMRIGAEKVKEAGLGNIISFKKEDCEHMSYNDGSFDAITTAFGIRNFQNLDACLKEMCRVLRTGGQLSILELSRPIHFPMKQLFHIYEKAVMPFIGKLISHDGYAYSYLPKTMDAVPQGEDMKTIFEKAGFHNVEYKRLAFGMCMMYIGRK